MRNDRDCLHRRQRWHAFNNKKGIKRPDGDQRSWSCQKGKEALDTSVF